MADFSKPGNDGGARPAEVDVDVTASLDLPGVLPCGKWFALEATVRQDCPGCESPQYRKLYRRAEELVNGLYEQLSCPDACPFQELRLRRGTWSCRNGVATAYVRKLTGCRGGAANLPGGADDVDVPEDFSKPYQPLDDLDPTTKGTFRIDEDWPEDEDEPSIAGLGCPEERTLRLITRARVEKCPGDYKPFVDKATAAALVYARCHKCRAPCKLTTTILYVRWTCSDKAVRRQVRVDVYLTISCRRPA